MLSIPPSAEGPSLIIDDVGVYWQAFDVELLGPFNNIKGINTLTKELKACSLGRVTAGRDVEIAPK